MGSNPTRVTPHPVLAATPNRIHHGTMASPSTVPEADDREVAALIPDVGSRPSGGIARLVHSWTSRRCIQCGNWKPLFTGYCDTCWQRHGL